MGKTERRLAALCRSTWPRKDYSTKEERFPLLSAWRFPTDVFRDRCDFRGALRDGRGRYRVRADPLFSFARIRQICFPESPCLAPVHLSCDLGDWDSIGKNNSIFRRNAYRSN